MVVAATHLYLMSIPVRSAAHHVQDSVKTGRMLLEHAPDLRPSPDPEEEKHPQAVATPLVGPSTFSTLPGVTAANINDKVTCIEPSSRS